MFSPNTLFAVMADAVTQKTPAGIRGRDHQKPEPIPRNRSGECTIPPRWSQPATGSQTGHARRAAKVTVSLRSIYCWGSTFRQPARLSSQHPCPSLGIDFDTRIGELVWWEAAGTLRRTRLAAGLSLRALAERAGTSHATLAAYESGRTIPRVDTLDRIP